MVFGCPNVWLYAQRHQNKLKNTQSNANVQSYRKTTQLNNNKKEKEKKISYFASHLIVHRFSPFNCCLTREVTSKFCRPNGLTCLFVDRFRIALFSASEQALCSDVILHERTTSYSAFLNIHRSGVLTALAWLLPFRRVLFTPCNHAQCHFMQSHIRKVYAYLTVTCQLHFWQNDRGLLRATAVTRGWNEYRNKSQHRKLALEKKILPPLLPGFEPATFWSWVRHSNHWAIPALLCSWNSRSLLW